MPPRFNPFTARTAAPVFRPTSTSLASRRSIASILSATSRPQTAAGANGLKSSLLSSQSRLNSSKSDGEGYPERLKGPTEDPLPHASEEAAEMARILDHEKKCDGTPASPELEQGTPVSEVLSRDEEDRKYAPKVMQNQTKGPSGTRSFSTSTRRSQAELHGEPLNDETVAVMANMISSVNQQATEVHPGLKFAPVQDLPKSENFRQRYDSVLDQFTKQLMTHGKLSKAEKNMTFILDHLRTNAPPNINPRRPLLGHPVSSQLPLNPVQYLTLLIDSVAPLVKVKQIKGAAGGGAALALPAPLQLRQRRRLAIRWIIDASDKRRDSMFAQRVANELVAVAEGRSGAWERREHLHKLSVAARANLGLRR